MSSRILFLFVLISAVWVSVARAQDEEPGVAVLDVGTNADVNVVDGFNFLNGTTDTSDQSENNHGTTVSLIINQEAPDIPQYQYVVDVDVPSATDAALLKSASNPDVKVIAYSSAVISSPSPAIGDASSAGKFIAIRTGNSARDNPDPAAVAAAGLPGVVIVTGTNGGGGHLLSANACGVTAERCVGVRGTTEFNSIFGTSFAAARMAGIAAEVLRAAPYLDNEELAQVIFATAEDTGDPRLGNGYIANAEQVINSPAGPTKIGGGGGGIGIAALGVGGAAAAALLLRDDDNGLEKTMVLDSFGRPFYVDLTKLAHVDDDRGSIAGFFSSLEQRHDSTRVQIGDNVTLDAAYVTTDLHVVDPGKYFAFDDDPAFNDRDMNWVLSLRGEYANGFHYELDRNRDPAMNFGVLNTVYDNSASGRSRFLSGQAFSVPLLTFSNSADSIGFGFAGDSGFGLDFGLVNTNENREHGRESVAAVVEGSYNFHDRAEISVQVGHLKEDGSLFGGASNGAFSVDNTNTMAASVSGSLLIADHTHLIGNYGVARSEIEDAKEGLLSNFSTVRSDWFGLGIVSDQVFRKGDQFGLALSRPLKVTDGDVDLRVPYARDFDGNIYNHTDRISLAPEGNEYALESYYLYQLDQKSSLGAYFMVRHDPNHFANSGSDVTVLASYRARL